MANFLDKASSSITGSIEKGYLMVRKEIIQEVNDEYLGTVSSLGTGLSRFASAIEDTANVLSNSTNLLGNNLGLTKSANRNGFMPIKVQYNPSSIRFSGSRGTASFDHNGTFIDNPRPADNIMSIDLYFDTENNATAFMLDKNSTDVVKGTAKAIYNHMSNEVTTVRYMVELLIGATVFNSTRWVGFAWRNIEFWGELISVNATYLMFDIEGEPVRAKVSLRIRQNTSNITDIKNNGESERKQNIRQDTIETRKKIKALGKKKASWTSSVSNILNI